MLQFRAVILGIVVLLQQQIPPVAPLPAQPFDEWLSGVRAEALTRGIRETTIDQAFAGRSDVAYRFNLHAGAHHGYALPDRDVYDRAAVETDWQEIFAMFDRQLTPSPRAHPGA